MFTEDLPGPQPDWVFSGRLAMQVVPDPKTASADPEMSDGAMAWLVGQGPADSRKLLPEDKT